MNKFFSLLAGPLLFASLYAAQPQYGICVLNQDILSAPEKFDAIFNNVELEFSGFSMKNPGFPVFVVKDYMQAKQLIALLKMHGYQTEIIEIRYDDAPNATVLSIAAFEQIMQSMAPMLESLEGMEDDEARARLTEALEKEFAAARA